MRTVRTKVYKFSELSDKAKEVALNECRYFNVDHDWWDSTFMDAERIGLKITGFDLDRNRHCTGHFIGDALECANKILAEHGEMCETYKTAQTFIQDRDALVEKHSDGVDLSIVSEDNEYEFDQECDELEEEFLASLLEDYSIILQKDYEYFLSDEAVEESIEANEFEFLETGKRY